ncbi:MAG: hypothetical protein GY799_07955 [Desulfobulbaceae bacterium]|nr:hypothetical protein [Desulfobulbaceae bacterium]
MVNATFISVEQISKDWLQIKLHKGGMIMEDKHDNRQFRQVGRGFIINQMEGMAGRVLTQTFVDQKKRPYVKVNGKIVPLTEQHDYLAAN